MPKEVVINSKIGSENDNYLMHAIKHKKIEIVKFLMNKVPEMNLLY